MSIESGDTSERPSERVGGARSSQNTGHLSSSSTELIELSPDSGHLSNVTTKLSGTSQSNDFLSNLPVELLLEIADFLPTSSIACLSFCNRRLSAHLGPRSWKLLSCTNNFTYINLKKQKILGTGVHAELVTFLETLERDIPDHYFCRCCMRIVSTEFDDLFRTKCAHSRYCLHLHSSTHKRLRATRICPVHGMGFLNISRIRFLPLGQLVPPRQLFKRTEGIPTHTFLPKKQDALGLSWLFFNDIKMIENECFVRSQLFTMLPPKLVLERLPGTEQHVVICEHNEITLRQYLRSGMKAFQESHTLKINKPHTSEVYSCKYCVMDFSCTLISQGGKVAQCLTRWHVLRGEINESAQKWTVGPWLGFTDHGSIAEKYESQPGNPFYESTTENFDAMVENRPGEMLEKHQLSSIGGLKKGDKNWT